MSSIRPATDLDHKRLEADMNANGFLSPELDHHLSAITDAHPIWFDLATRLNRLAMKVWLEHPIVREGLAVNAKEPVTVRLMARSISGYEGAIILLQRGMTVEAGTLIRSIYETAFWIGYILHHETAALKFFELDELRSKEGRFKAYEKLFSTDAEKLAGVRAELVAIRSQLRGEPKAPSIEDIATRGGVGNHYANYKLLCGTSAHASITSTGHYLEFYEDRTVGHVIGPDIAGTGRMIAFAVHSLIVAFLGFAQAVDSEPFGKELEAICKEYFSRAKGFSDGTLA